MDLEFDVPIVKVKASKKKKKNSKPKDRATAKVIFQNSIISMPFYNFYFNVSDALRAFKDVVSLHFTTRHLKICKN